MKKTLLSLLLFLFCAAGSFALQQKSDAPQRVRLLKDQIRNNNVDSVRINRMLQLSSLYLKNFEMDSAMKYAMFAVEHSEIVLDKSNLTQGEKDYKKLRAKSMLNLGAILMYHNTNWAFDTVNVALKLWEETNDQIGIGQTHAVLAEIYNIRGYYAEALRHLNQSLSLFLQANRKDKEAETYHARGIVKRYMRNYGDALEDNFMALKLAKELKDTVLITDALLANGFNYMLVKKIPEALENQEEALKIFISQNDSLGIATTYNDLGVTHFQTDQLEEALKQHKEALKIRLKFQSDIDLAISYSYIAQTLNEMDELEDALVNGLEGLKHAKRSGDVRFIMDGYRNAGDISKYLKDFDNSLLYYDSLLTICKEYNNISDQAITLTSLGELYRMQGNTDKALASLLEAEELVLSADYQTLRDIYKEMNTTYYRSKNYRSAYHSLIKYHEANDSLMAGEKMEKITGLTQQLIFENNLALQRASQEKQILIKEGQIKRQTMIRNISIFGLLLVVFFALILFLRFRENRKLNVALEKSIGELKATQSQLIQSEKMASLGELTAGIAHEIQNPLNFVNNFAEVTNELIDEMNEEIANGDFEEVKLITKDVKQNLQLINTHGKRADSIVKGMLQHSRNNKGLQEPTDINKLADEYLRLAFHGLRAKDKTFNANFETHFDENMGLQRVVPQDLGRVILNLITNAFYAVNEKKNAGLNEDYKPNVIVTTKKTADAIIIAVKDNGNGIPQKILSKLFQPFFSTKPSGEGTGLGLSLSYDIVKAKGGEIKVNTEEGKFTEFKIILPHQ